MLQQQDSVGLVTFDKQVRRYIPPRARPKHLQAIINELKVQKPEFETALSDVFHVIIFQIWDPDELDFPFRQWTQFASLEAASNRHLVDPAQIRRAYLEKLAQFRDQLASGCNRHRISLVPMTTDQPHADVLAAYLALRRRGR